MVNYPHPVTTVPSNSCELTQQRDNEKPARQVDVHSFQAQGRPISNEEVSLFLIYYSLQIGQAKCSWLSSMRDICTARAKTPFQHLGLELPSHRRLMEKLSFQTVLTITKMATATDIPTDIASLKIPWYRSPFSRTKLYVQSMDLYL